MKGAEPVQHRFAYVLGGTATAFMRTLATRPDSILVSAETIKDCQLAVGDTINLRLVDTRTGTPRPVAF